MSEKGLIGGTKIPLPSHKLQSVEDLVRNLWDEECQHAQYRDDDPYGRANPPPRRTCGECVADTILGDRTDVLEARDRLWCLAIVEKSGDPAVIEAITRRFNEIREVQEN